MTQRAKNKHGFALGVEQAAQDGPGCSKIGPRISQVGLRWPTTARGGPRGLERAQDGREMAQRAQIARAQEVQRSTSYLFNGFWFDFWGR